MNYQQFLNPGETLSRVRRYEVGRKQGRVLIDLHETLGGPSDAKFIAMPYLVFVGRAKLEFYGYGETEEEALFDCLEKIKNESYSAITGADDIAELE